jgi:CheY-like chemotaxis protein
MIKKLLGFSRRDMLAIRSVQIARVLGEFAGTLTRILPEHIELQMEPVDPDLIVRADEAAVEQILINLATNARDAMPGGGTLTIAARPIAQGPRDDDRFVSLVVTDTGAGMTPDILEHAFEPFFTTKPPDKGSGLGLAMIYGLARQHGGSVELLSEPERGTTVMVNLPVAAAIAQQPHQESRGSETLPGGTETILVVEDEPAIRNAARRVLEKYGYTVIEAADGFEALELFHQHETQIDLIVCDVVMPKLGGQRVLDALRLEGKSVPFLFTSGHTSRGGGEGHAIDESMPFLPKPWDAEDLLVEVRTLLDDRP